MYSGLRVAGSRELQSAYSRAETELETLPRITQTVAHAQQTKATQTAPRRTGALAAAVRTVTEHGNVIIVAGGPRVPYAPIIHWGWRAHSIKPNPWITRAVLDTEPQTLDAYTAGIQTILDETVGRVNG